MKIWKAWEMKQSGHGYWTKNWEWRLWWFSCASKRSKKTRKIIEEKQTLRQVFGEKRNFNRGIENLGYREGLRSRKKERDGAKSLELGQDPKQRWMDRNFLEGKKFQAHKIIPLSKNKTSTKIFSDQAETTNQHAAYTWATRDVQVTCAHSWSTLEFMFYCGASWCKLNFSKKIKFKCLQKDIS